MKTVRVRMLKTVTSELPRQLWDGKTLIAPEGAIYDARANKHGALTVELEDGSMFGIKPGEYEELPESNVSAPIISRVVDVIPGEEIHVFIHGNKDARFIAYPKRGVITVPGCRECNLEELKNWRAALRAAVERMDWK